MGNPNSVSISVVHILSFIFVSIIIFDRVRLDPLCGGFHISTNFND